MKRILFLFSLLIAQHTFSQKTIAIKCGQLLDTRSGIIKQKQTIYVKGNVVSEILVA